MKLEHYATEFVPQVYDFSTPCNHQYPYEVGDNVEVGTKLILYAARYLKMCKFITIIKNIETNIKIKNRCGD